MIPPLVSCILNHIDMNRFFSSCLTLACIALLASCGGVEGPRTGTYYDFPDKNDSTSFIKRMYNEQHILKLEVPYVNRKPEGISREYYDDGKLKMEIAYKDGLRNGTSKLYYESGQLNMEMNYKDDKRDGLMITYYKNGVKAYAAQFANNEQIPGIREFRESGDEVAQPEIVLKKVGSTLLEISLSKERKGLEMYWYASPEATTGLPVSVTPDGVGQLGTHRGQYVRVRVAYKTNYGNNGMLEAETTM